MRIMIVNEAKVAIFSFLIVLLQYAALELIILPNLITGFYLGIICKLLFYSFFCLILHFGLDKSTFDIAWRSIFLGFIFSLGIFLYFKEEITLGIFGLYLITMSFFHFSEYLSIALTNPKVLRIDSFILNHSRAYHIAAVSSWTEFFIERYFFEDLKSYQSISLFGFGMCVIGEILRKLAIFTARKNFNHIVQNEKVDSHKLVTDGVYRLFRHPSYVGWFYWSIGTQIILLNPVCFVAYIITSWIFFNERIFNEEIHLIRFFGHDYIVYQEKVGTGLPFIKGYTFSKQR